MKYLLCLCMMFFLSSCTYQQMSGRKQGAGQAEFSNDYIECQAVSKRVKNYISDETVFMCMQGKGWKMETKTKLMPLF